MTPRRSSTHPKPTVIEPPADLTLTRELSERLAAEGRELRKTVEEQIAPAKLLEPNDLATRSR